jgi:hypothetical protein
MRYRTRIRKFDVNKIYIFLILVLVCYIGIGYSIIQSKINVSGKATIAAYSNMSLALDWTSDAVIDSSIDFSHVSSELNGRGLYIMSGTQNDSHPIYYYRGDVSNNNVLYADTCWKIVRTTNKGGTKLLYNGLPTNGECDNTGGDTYYTPAAYTHAYASEANANPGDVGWMSGTAYTYHDLSDAHSKDLIYGNDVNYSVEDDLYTLINTYDPNGRDYDDVKNGNLTFSFDGKDGMILFENRNSTSIRNYVSSDRDSFVQLRSL